MAKLNATNQIMFSVKLLLQIFMITFIACFIQVAHAFVLLSPEAPTLPATLESPTIEFYLVEFPPSIKDKNSFEKGVYAKLSDLEFFVAIVNKAMEPWNSIPGSFIKLKVSPNPGVQVNSLDNINTIAVGSTSATSAAFATPEIKNNKITDCDITIGTRTVSAENLAFTLMHELGHCLGLGHNHINYSAVMGYSRLNYSLNLSLDDIAGLLYLYPEDNSVRKELVGCGIIASKNASNNLYLYAANFMLIFLPLLLLLINKKTKPKK